MASRFWVLGTGTWDASATTNWSATSGGTGGASVPGTADTVTFDTNSGTGTVTLSANTTVVSVTVDKAGLTVLCNAQLNTNTGAVTLRTGTLNTNGQTCSWSSFQGAPSGAGTRSLVLGASTITLTSNTQPWQLASTTGWTLTPGTSSLLFTGNGPALISLGGQTYWDVTVQSIGSGSTSFSGNNNRFHNLTINGGSGRTGSVQIQNNTVDGLLTIHGNSSLNRLLVQSTASGSRRTFTAAATALDNVDFQDVGAAGTAAPFTGVSLGDADGNAAINFDAGLSLYRVGAAGNWSDLATWFTDDVTINDDGTTTPRTPRVPLAQDTVAIDSRATGSINVDMPRLGRGLDLSGFAGTFAASLSITVYGSITLSNDPAFSITGSAFSVFLAGRQTSQLLTSNGKTIPQGFRIEAPGGIYSLQDDLTLGGGIILTDGSLDANDRNVNIATFASTAANNARTLTMGTGTWTLTGTGTVWNVTTNTALVLTPESSTIIVANTSATAKVFTGNGRTYHDLTFAGGTGTLTLGGSTFATVTLPPAANVIFTSDTTTTVTELAAVGTPGNLISISSSIPGTSAAIRKLGGQVVADYLTLQDSSATGTAQFYAGVHSVDNGNNTGWQFAAPSPGTNRLLSFFAGRL